MSRESCILGTNSEENKSNHLAVWLKLNAPFLIRELERGSPGSFLWFRTLICKGSYSQATMDTFLTPCSLHMWRWS